MMRNSKRVLSKAQILDRVWSYDFGGRSNIVELYISYLRKKIDNGREPMIHTLRGAGYVLKPGPAWHRRGPGRCVHGCWSGRSSSSRSSASASPRPPSWRLPASPSLAQLDGQLAGASYRSALLYPEPKRPGWRHESRFFTPGRGPGPRFLDAPGQPAGMVAAVVNRASVIDAGYLTSSGARAALSPEAQRQLEQMPGTRSPHDARPRRARPVPGDRRPEPQRRRRDRHRPVDGERRRHDDPDAGHPGHRHRGRPGRGDDGRRLIIRRALAPLRRVAADGDRGRRTAAGPRRGRTAGAGGRSRRQPRDRGGATRRRRSTGCSTTSRRPCRRGRPARPGSGSSSPTPATNCGRRSPPSAGTPN